MMLVIVELKDESDCAYVQADMIVMKALALFFITHFSLLFAVQMPLTRISQKNVAVTKCACKSTKLRKSQK